jgi:nicotinamidase-related amidase
MDKDMGRVLVRGEPGNGLEEAVAPLAGELVIHKPGKGAFWNTNLENELIRRGVRSLIFTGVTTEVCVQTTMREANDRGFDCIVVEEATASYIPRFKDVALDMISSQGGIVGWRCKLAEVLSALEVSTLEP